VEALRAGQRDQFGALALDLPLPPDHVYPSNFPVHLYVNRLQMMLKLSSGQLLTLFQPLLGTNAIQAVWILFTFDATL
jgi:hypothetical protein